jgi:hypothetical protein
MASRGGVIGEAILDEHTVGVPDALQSRQRPAKASRGGNGADSDQAVHSPAEAAAEPAPTAWRLDLCIEDL